MKRRSPQGKTPSRQIGLARALSKLGYCSRSQAAALIHSGRVALNEIVRRDPETPVHMERDRISVEGFAVQKPGLIYLVLNKQRGVVTTASDEKGRETVYASLAEGTPWVAPVGRLDKASEGLLLLTNDSEWAARVLAPETHLDKTYHVQIESGNDAKLAKFLVQGVKTSEGDFLRAKSARLLRSGEKNCWLEVVLDEGKNRQIRRMLAALNVEVKRLVRVAIGPLGLGELPKGAVRRLSEAEKSAMDRAMSSRRNR